MISNFGKGLLLFLCLWTFPDLSLISLNAEFGIVFLPIYTTGMISTETDARDQIRWPGSIIYPPFPTIQKMKLTAYKPVCVQCGKQPEHGWPRWLQQGMPYPRYEAILEEDVSIAFPQYSNDNQLTFLSTVIVYGILVYSVDLQTKIKIRIPVTLDRQNKEITHTHSSCST